MKEMLSRLRASFTPQAALFFSALLLLAACLTASFTDSVSSLEKRIEQTLSLVEGAGDVHVVIRTKSVQSTNGMASKNMQTLTLGAVAVAEGADNPVVRMEIEEALCALLGLPPSSVSVMSGGK